MVQSLTRYCASQACKTSEKSHKTTALEPAINELQVSLSATSGALAYSRAQLDAIASSAHAH